MKGTTEIHPRTLWRLNASAPGKALDVNCYLLAVTDGFCLIDAGPAALGWHLVHEAQTITPVSEIRSIIILDDSAFSSSAIPLWTASGFHGEVIADWRVIAAMTMGGIHATFNDMQEGETLIFSEGKGLDRREREDRDPPALVET
jgi:hypothetical protein